MRSLILLASAALLSSTIATAQGVVGTSLYLRGPGQAYGVIFNPPVGLGADQTFNLPATGGTLVTTGSLGGNFWVSEGNTLVGAGVTENRLGSLSDHNVALIAGGNTNVRLELLWDDHATLLPNQAELRFGEAAANGSEYIGLTAPAAITTSYSVALPATAPIAGQVLRATSATATEWGTVSGGGGATGAAAIRATDLASNTNTWVDALTVAVDAATTYYVQARFEVTTDGSGRDPQFQFTAPGTATMTYGYTVERTTSHGRAYVAAIGDEQSPDVTVNNSIVVINLTGKLITNTAGNFNLRFRATPGGGPPPYTETTTLFAGATLFVSPL